MRLPAESATPKADYPPNYPKNPFCFRPEYSPARGYWLVPESRWVTHAAGHTTVLLSTLQRARHSRGRPAAGDISRGEGRQRVVSEPRKRGRYAAPAFRQRSAAYRVVASRTVPATNFLLSRISQHELPWFLNQQPVFPSRQHRPHTLDAVRPPPPVFRGKSDGEQLA